MMKSDQFHRKGFKEVRKQVDDVMTGQFKSELVEDFKSNDYVIDREGVKVYLAKVCTITTIAGCLCMICVCVLDNAVPECHLMG